MWGEDRGLAADSGLSRDVSSFRGDAPEDIRDKTTRCEHRDRRYKAAVHVEPRVPNITTVSMLFGKREQVGV